jgi:hypothetical protein
MTHSSFDPPSPDLPAEGREPKPSTKRTLRFSLRTLLILIAVIGLAAYWFSRSALLADRFVAAVQAGRFDDADRMFRQKPKLGLEQLMQRSYRMGITARREAPSLFDWIRGITRVRVTVEDLSGWDHYTFDAELEVSRRGVQPPAWGVEKVKRGPGIMPVTMGAVRQ